MKIALAQVNCHIGNFTGNKILIKQKIEEARKLGAQLVVFPELALSGYPPLDFLEFNHFTKKCSDAIDEIANSCHDIDVIIGSPSKNPVKEGKNLFNSAFFIAKGKVARVINKSLLPTYDVFDEYRYFEPNKKYETIVSNGVRIALTICEDLWNEEDDPMYVTSPMEHLMQQQPELIINIAASPFDHSHREKRIDILKRNVNKFDIPLVYVNHVGAQTDLLFDGGSLQMDRKGNIIRELKYFNEDLQIIDPFEENEPNHQPHQKKIERIHDGLVMGIRDYFKKLGFSKAILGLSGGIDSAVVLALSTKALGSENVLPVMMPSSFSSDHSLSDSIELCNNLKIDPDKIPIQKIYESFLKDLDYKFSDTEFNVAEENIQSRIRGTLLMALSNKFGHILLNTSNKSELAVGYGTLYGDMCGGLSVIGDLYKRDVYDLARFINTHQSIIPENIITKEPSAELRPDQKDSDSLPEYDLLDSILYQYIELQQGYDRILEQGFDKETVEKVLKLVNSNEYKRFQFAPILRVSPKAFGFGRRMPLVAKYLS
jgi:NAD+ synthase (glutamine-hydrolysing)